MIFLKLLIALIIFIIALISGIVPLLVKVTDRTKLWLLYGEYFACGIFLGAGVIHLLPESLKNLHFTMHYQYPIAFLICALSILFLRIIEEGCAKSNYAQIASHQTWMAFLLTLLLSIHSILAGIALGVEMMLASFIMIFIAIIAHKGAAAFALGINMRKSTLKRSTMIKLMILFSAMTPSGILLGSSFMALLHAKAGYLAQGIFDAIAAGTFIYIAAFHSFKLNGTDSRASISIKLLSFSLGLIMMAIIAIWV